MIWSNLEILNPSFVFVIWSMYEASSVSGIGLSTALWFWYSGCSCVFCPGPSVITSPSVWLVSLFRLDCILALKEMDLSTSTISSYVFCGGLSSSTFGYSYPVKTYPIIYPMYYFPHAIYEYISYKTWDRFYGKWEYKDLIPLTTLSPFYQTFMNTKFNSVFSKKVRDRNIPVRHVIEINKYKLVN